MVGLQQVGHAALAGLRVDADDRLVAAAQVFRVDREVGNGPLQLVDALALRFGVGRHGFEALLDGILVRAAEGGEHEVAGPRAALVHGQLIAVLGRALHCVDVAEVDLRVDALGEQVDAQGDQVDVAGALPVAEQAPFDAVRAGHVAELGRRDRGTAVVVRMQRQDDVLAVCEVPRHPFDRVCIHVGGGHLNGRWKVDDDLAFRGRFEDFEDLVADVDGELEFRAGVTLGRVLVVDRGAGRQRLHFTADARAVQGDVDDPLLVGTEHHIALQHAGRVVEVHNGLLRAHQ